jgi:hypothetical protein
MWGTRKKDMTRIQDCANLLSLPSACKQAMERAIESYPISAEQHLSKPNGRRPWIGAAACCVQLGANEEETRVAWNFYMSPEAQERANAIADEVIAAWEENYA